jgi:hypothetical protein
VAESSARAVTAATEVADELGLRFAKPLILWERSNLLVHLSPAPVVARIATNTGTMRRGDAWLAREIAVAGYLAEAGAPVVAPASEVPAGPHHRDGFVLTFWEYVEETSEPLDAAEAGRRLRLCHEALANFEGDLSSMAPLVEAESIAERLATELDGEDSEVVRRAVVEARRDIERFELPTQALHGDAGLSNVLQSARGPLWNDREDTFHGPLAWDLACLEAAAPPFGSRDPALIAAALAGYGSTLTRETLDVFVAARRIQASLWGVAIALANGDLDSVNSRLDWFRHR